jgi:hypothetical protein
VQFFATFFGHYRKIEQNGSIRSRFFGARLYASHLDAD